MATLTPTVAVSTGVVPSSATPTATTGDTFLNTGREIVRVYNGSGDAVTITFDLTVLADGIAFTDPGYSVAAGAVKYFGPFLSGYNDTAGHCKFTLSAVTDVEVEVVKVPNL